MKKKYLNDSLPNPYDYESIKLDSNVTSDDLDNLSKYLVDNKDVLVPNVKFLNKINKKLAVDGKSWLLCRTPAVNKKSDEWGDFDIIDNLIAFTIVDKENRVGVVSFEDNRVQWACWDETNNYSVRGVMKMLDLLMKENLIQPILKDGFKIRISPWNMNEKNIKDMELLKIDVSNPVYEFSDDFWWNDINKKIVGYFYRNPIRR